MSTISNISFASTFICTNMHACMQTYISNLSVFSISSMMKTRFERRMIYFLENERCVFTILLAFCTYSLVMVDFKLWNFLYHKLKCSLLTVCSSRCWTLTLISSPVVNQGVTFLHFAGKWPFIYVYLDIEHWLVEKPSTCQPRCCCCSRFLMHLLDLWFYLHQQVLSPPRSIWLSFLVASLWTLIGSCCVNAIVLQIEVL